jgi:endoglucanase
MERDVSRKPVFSAANVVHGGLVEDACSERLTGCVGEAALSSVQELCLPARHKAEARDMEGFNQGVSRRQILTFPLAAALGCSTISNALANATELTADPADWAAFLTRFVAPDGRVIDTGNGGISHSEGQGWGMFFAVVYDDPATFARISGWTSRALRRDKDALHAWRYVPSDNPPVGDINSATDADLFIAFALARAARRWGRPDYAHAAAAIARDVQRILVRNVAGRTVLLPGARGFVTDRAVIVNPSYYVFPAFSELSELAPSPIWAKLASDGLALIAAGRFGRWALPPDWLQISTRNGGLAPAPGWPPRFSYDAIRVPLYLAWGRQLPPTIKEAFTAFWSSWPMPQIPAWVDLTTDALAPYPGPPGFQAVAQLILDNTQPPPAAEPFPAVASAPDYYSAALTMLAKVALSEVSRTKGGYD